VVDQLDSTAVRNLVAIDIAKEWTVVLVQDIAVQNNLRNTVLDALTPVF
jgi:hypothetical protein